MHAKKGARKSAGAGRNAPPARDVEALGMCGDVPGSCLRLFAHFFTPARSLSRFATARASSALGFSAEGAELGEPGSGVGAADGSLVTGSVDRMEEVLDHRWRDSAPAPSASARPIPANVAIAPASGPAPRRGWGRGAAPSSGARDGTVPATGRRAAAGRFARNMPITSVPRGPFEGCRVRGTGSPIGAVPRGPPSRASRGRGDSTCAADSVGIAGTGVVGRTLGNCRGVEGGGSLGFFSKLPTRSPLLWALRRPWLRVRRGRLGREPRTRSPLDGGSPTSHGLP